MSAIDPFAAVVTFTIAVAVFVGIFLLCRVLWLWYWRVNDAIERLDRMVELQKLTNRQLSELVLLGQGRPILRKVGP